MEKINKRGRTFESGKALSTDFRRLIIDRILEKGGNRTTQEIPCGYAFIARYFKVAPNTVKKIWKQFCNEYSEERLPVCGGRRLSLSAGDLELIEVLKLTRGSISLAEVWDILVNEFGDVENVSLSTISRAIRNKMPSGRRYTRKKITRIASERFTDNNVLYTQLFINYLNAQDPHHVKFFDEAGIKFSDCSRNYGHSPVGERCVEICRKTPSPSYTLSAMCSLNGIEYAKVINGASNTVEFLQFFEEAGQSVNATTGLPSLSVDDIIVMDNLSSHHYEGGAALEEWLGEIGIELLYTPTYSPDLNPIEECFSKIKRVLTNYHVNSNVYSIKASVIDATSKVTASDMLGYYRHTGYFRL